MEARIEEVCNCGAHHGDVLHMKGCPKYKLIAGARGGRVFVPPEYFLWRAFDKLTADQPVRSEADLVGVCIVANMLARATGEPLVVRDSVDWAVESGVVR